VPDHTRTASFAPAQLTLENDRIVPIETIPALHGSNAVTPPGSS